MEGIKNILLVEDDPAHADLISRSFRNAQTSVPLIQVASIEEARKSIAQGWPSIILSDYSLADGKCTELLHEFGAEIPFVILTSQGNEQLALELMRDGAEDYWVKGPESFRLIPDIVRRIHLSWNVRLERKQKLLHDLERANYEAESASRSKNAFLANMSHEIRTPMNVILGMTHLAIHANADVKVKGYLQKVEDSAKSLLRLLNGILDFARMEGRVLELEFIHFDLEDILTEAGSSVKAEAQRKGIELLFEVESSVPRRLVGDPLRLGQILYNLVGNSVKFSDTGAIYIQVAKRQEKNSRIELQFTVKDCGVGISSENLENLFKPFEQGDASISRKFGGVGLGLSICRHLIELMDGKIWAESVLGQGSSFHFTIWLSRDQRPESIPDLSGIQDLRVMVVDDSESARDSLDSMLRTLKIRPILAESGADALRILSEAAIRKEVPDMIMMDWMMPHMDGIETAKIIHADQNLTQKPALVMMTAGNRADLEEQSREFPVSGFLAKPFTFSQLLDVVLEVCGKNQFEKQKGVLASEESLGLEGAHVLLVDDNFMARKMANRLLVGNGAKVTTASNGQDALDILFSQEFDLMVIDCQMPVMDGYEATRRIRRNPKYSQFPILAMTASVLMEDRVRCILAGMNEHIGKPLDKMQFLDAVKRWLRYSKQLNGNKVAHAETLESIGSTQPWLDPETILVTGGFDLQTAITRLGGDWHVYRNMLAGFVRNQSHAPEDIQIALRTGDTAAAIRGAHSLKGVAAYLGITGLQSLAKTIEDHIGVLDDKEVESLIEELRIVLDRNLDVIHSYQRCILNAVVENTDPPVEGDQLESMLNTSDSAAVEIAQSFSAQNGGDSEKGKLAMQVAEFASRYQYAEALNALRRWKEK